MRAVGADIHDVASAMGQDGRISDSLHPGPGFGDLVSKDLVSLIAVSKEKNVRLRP